MAICSTCKHWDVRQRRESAARCDKVLEGVTPTRSGELIPGVVLYTFPSFACAAHELLSGVRS